MHQRHVVPFLPSHHDLMQPSVPYPQSTKQEHCNERVMNSLSIECTAQISTLALPCQAIVTRCAALLLFDSTHIPPSLFYSPHTRLETVRKSGALFTLPTALKAITLPLLNLTSPPLDPLPLGPHLQPLDLDPAHPHRILKPLRARHPAGIRPLLWDQL